MSTWRRAALTLSLTIGLTAAATGTAAAGTPQFEKFHAGSGGGYLRWIDYQYTEFASTEDADDVTLIDTRKDERGVYARIEHPTGQYIVRNRKGTGESKAAYRDLRNLKPGQFMTVTVCLLKKNSDKPDPNTCSRTKVITE